MTTFLYNCKDAGDQYRITKFDDDLNPISDYLTTLTECDCPAGHRDTCRHRLMLPRFISQNHINDGNFHNYERNIWLSAAGAQVNEEANEPLCAEGAVVNERSLETDASEDYSLASKGGALRELGATEIPLGPSINLLALADPFTIHNTIAAALNEPQLAPSPRLLDLQPTRQLPPSPELGNQPPIELKRRV